MQDTFTLLLPATAVVSSTVFVLLAMFCMLTYPDVIAFEVRAGTSLMYCIDQTGRLFFNGTVLCNETHALSCTHLAHHELQSVNYYYYYYYYYY